MSGDLSWTARVYLGVSQKDFYETIKRTWGFGKKRSEMWSWTKSWASTDRVRFALGLHDQHVYQRRSVYIDSSIQRTRQQLGELEAQRLAYYGLLMVGPQPKPKL